MADVATSISIVEQIRLVSSLRWRILRNSLRKKNNRLDLIGLIFAGAFSSILVAGLCFAFYVGAREFLSKGRPGWIGFLFWGVFLFWQVFPIFIAGFGSSFEFRTLLDEPFEGVDALAAGALKALLGRMTERGTTIFLTSHVLEIVERLCSHVAIIHRGRLVAQGSLEELRAGVSGEHGSKTSLEQIFLSIVGQDGAARPQIEELSWLM